MSTGQQITLQKQRAAQAQKELRLSELRALQKEKDFKFTIKELESIKKKYSELFVESFEAFAGNTAFVFDSNSRISLNTPTVYSTNQVMGWFGYSD
jgi:hypothetical protein